MKEYKSYYELQQLYNLDGYGLVGSKKRELLIENGELEAIIIDGKTYFSVESIEKYLLKIDSIRKDYLVIHEFLEDFVGIDSLHKNYYPKVKELSINSCLELLVLDTPITKGEKYFIKKSSYQQFKRDYISITEAFNQIKLSSSLPLFRKALKREGINVAKFLTSLDFMYVRKEDLKVFDAISKGVNVTDAQKMLNIPTPPTFYKILKNYKIETHRGIKGMAFILKKDIEYLKSIQDRFYKEYDENFYTYEEIKIRFNEAGSKKENHYVLQKTEKVEIPDIARIKRFKNKISIYRKIDIDNYIDELKKEREITKLCDMTTSNYYGLLLDIIKIDNISFSEGASTTKEFWFRYAKLKLNNLQGSHDTRIRRVANLRYVTRLLTEFTTTKELFGFSEKELNFSLFNQNIARSYQKELFSFLNTLNESLEKHGKKIFDLKKISYSSESPNNTIKEKETYSVDEYLALYSFVSDFEKHKKLVIEDVKNALTDKRKYKKLDSFWLYVLIHMNNGWRKSDVIEFPRLPFSLFEKYNLTSIESIENLHLTFKEAEQIVKYYQLQWFQHNKTKEKATFYCSSVLTIPIAYAILVCEFRCRMLHIHDEKFLIHFYTKHNSINSSTHNTFFQGFNETFKFESRKMNRTVLSLISSVINEKLKGDPVEVARHLRGHVSSETTNIYIQIPQEHLDFISKQLFDTGYFGYVYDQVGNLLIGNSPEYRSEKTKRSLVLKGLFGDVSKLEDTSTYLRHLSREREDLGKYLEELPKEELEKKMNLINLGLSPAKEENYQCFFSSCIANQRECNRCAFSIPHFYSLTTICERIKRTLINYEDALKDKEIPHGERTKLFNLFLSDYDKILGAKEKFGVEIIEMFLDIDFTEFDTILDEIPEPEPIA